MQRTIVQLVLLVLLTVYLSPDSVRGQDKVQGVELAAALNLHAQDIWLDGVLFVPEVVPSVRCVMVVIGWGRGQDLYRDQELRGALGEVECGLLQLTLRNIQTPTARIPVTSQVVRNAAVGGAGGLLMLLERLAEESGRPELKDVPVLLWGHSAAGSFGITFAALHPGRTIAFVRWNSHLRELPVAIEDVMAIPALMIAGEKDGVAGVEDTRDLWMKGRSAKAPWTLAVQPGAPHGSTKSLQRSKELLLPWIAAVLRARTPSGGSGLRSVSDASGWLGSHETAEVAAYDRFAGTKLKASWFPDELSARGWQSVLDVSR